MTRVDEARHSLPSRISKRRGKYVIKSPMTKRTNFTLPTQRTCATLQGRNLRKRHEDVVTSELNDFTPELLADLLV